MNDVSKVASLNEKDSMISSTKKDIEISERTTKQQPILQWKTKVKRSRRLDDHDTTAKQNLVQSEFSMNDKNGDDAQMINDGAARSSGPLIIPVLPDQNKWKQKPPVPTSSTATGSNDNSEDLAAIQALHDDATMHDRALLNGTTTIPSTTTTTIPSHANTFVSGVTTTMEDRDVKQYHTDIDALPAALDEMSEEYQRVPIAEFGAALLRGMGWNDNEQQSSTSTSDVMPRPHRLGLGAIPAILEPNKGGDEKDGGHGRRPRNIDQYERDQRTQKQNDMYRMEREKKLAADLQRTMRDGSIVHVLLPQQDKNSNTDGETCPERQRARIVKLVGVPGLNMVQLQMEDSATPIIVKRNEIDGLVSRDELDRIPFTDEEKRQVTESTVSKKGSSTDPINREKSSKNSSRRDDRHGHEYSDDRKSKKRSRKEEKVSVSNRVSWVIPNIRVRIVSEKLGRRYYKEKGIVVDVTRHDGVTLKLNNPISNSSGGGGGTNAPAVVVDRIPERYLETAVPNIGGNVIVVNPQHVKHFAKGRLMERDSSKNNCIVQLYDDMDCIRLSLDDIAEWCGPLDEDEER